ncbi:MAG: hypothetical protein ACKVP0_25900 [Pirellulaceae bacterium]
MTLKFNLRWFQFTIRGLLALIFLVAIPLARIANLRRIANFHVQEEHRIISEIAKLDGYNRLSGRDSPEGIEYFVSGALDSIVDQPSSDEGFSGWPTSRVLNRGRVADDWRLEAELWALAIHERRLAVTYDHAAWRPWMMVTEPRRPKIAYIVPPDAP